MKKITLVFAVILLILISGCRNLSGEQQSSETVGETPTQPAAATEVLSTNQDFTAEPPASSTEEKVKTPSTEMGTTSPAGQDPLTADPTAEPIPTKIIEQSDTSLPEPALLFGTWDDHAVYQAGLITEEAAVFQELPEATVYHLALDINDPYLVTGEMKARYFNQEDSSLNELFLHMFPKQLGGDMKVSNLLVNGEPTQYEVVDGMLRVDLDNPLAPGQGVVLSLAFETSVPGEETTKYGVLAFKVNILALAHFYPMFAVYDDQGWHTEPTAEHGDETFADASFYLVRVNAPENQTIVTSGVEVTQEIHDGQQQVTYAAGPARDFYLVASDDFEVVQEQVGQVLLRSYAPAGFLEGAQIALDATAYSLQSFSDRFGPYPYSELDVVTTPTDALGIEYPGIFANALRIYDLAGNTASGISNAGLIENVSVHEAAHQWFYNLVGNDQLNEPWLDEATAQYATWLYYIDRYGEQKAQGFYNSLEGRWGRAEYADIPIGLPADAYTGLEYSAIVYGRGPIFLNELAEIMGQETFDAFLRDFTDTYRWQIAYGEDFQTLAEQHCGCDLSELFAEQVFGN